ncbi:MAG TPA: hypothetical protein VJ438_06520 [Candidatus Nanoarchaeia archaeon]|nr:hypothetical protein [Candidatus Nanoarchaeia archaeon]
MRKTLTTLAFLGVLAMASAGCTPEGDAFMGGLVKGMITSGAQSYASEKGRVAANPALTESPQTNVTVYNPNPSSPLKLTPRNQYSLNTTPSVPDYWIDENMLDGSEEDLKEARAVYRVLTIGIKTIYKETKEEKEKYLGGCPEGFRTKYIECLNALDSYKDFMIKRRDSTTQDERMNNQKAAIIKQEVRQALIAIEREALKEGVRVKDSSKEEEEQTEAF